MPVLAAPVDAIVAPDVARGVARLLSRSGIAPLAEVSLGNGLRADIVGLGPDGRITLVEIKVAIGDLRGDGKWRGYLDYCDRYYWAVPPNFPLGDFATDGFMPERCGLIIADRWDAVESRPAPWALLSSARRMAETRRFARCAAQRLARMNDPGTSEAVRLP